MSRESRLFRPGLLTGLALVLGLALANPAAAAQARKDTIDDTPRDQLQRVERDLQGAEAKRKALEAEAERLAAEIAELDARVMAATWAVQAGEEALTGLEADQAELEAREQIATAGLEQRRAEMAATLAALERLGHRPPEALLAAPGAPVDNLRSAMLLGAVVPQIERQAAALKQSLAALAALRHDLAESRTAVSAGGKKLAGERAALDRLLRDKAARQAQARAGAQAEAVRVAALGEKSSDLKSLIQKLDDEAKRRAEAEVARQKAEAAKREAAIGAEAAAAETAHAAELAQARKLAAIRQSIPMSKAKGQLPLPVRGSLAGRYDEPSKFSGRLRGMTLKTREGAVVTAPQGGQVAFAGEFRGYGLLLIIAAGEGYHFLLAGLGRIDVSVGQAVQIGEPVGQLGAEGFQRDGAASGGGPELYVELRRRGEPIDPQPWFAPRENARSGKASG